MIKTMHVQQAPRATPTRRTINGTKQRDSDGNNREECSKETLGGDIETDTFSEASAQFACAPEMHASSHQTRSNRRLDQRTSRLTGYPPRSAVPLTSQNHPHQSAKTLPRSANPPSSVIREVRDRLLTKVLSCGVEPRPLETEAPRAFANRKEFMRVPRLKLTRNCAERIWVNTVIGRDVRRASVAKDTAEVEMNLLMFLEVRALKGRAEERASNRAGGWCGKKRAGLGGRE